jgi:hypothetical protein
LADARLRYLRQQIELGGPEVVTSRTSFPGPLEGKSAAKPDARPSWQKDAPEVPADGITVQPPVGVLDTDGLNELNLEEVAERIRTTFCCDL